MSYGKSCGNGKKNGKDKDDMKMPYKKSAPKKAMPKKKKGK
jgi:hypothetical protein